MVPRCSCKGGLCTNKHNSSFVSARLTWQTAEAGKSNECRCWKSAVRNHAFSKTPLFDLGTADQNWPTQLPADESIALRWPSSLLLWSQVALTADSTRMMRDWRPLPGYSLPSVADLAVTMAVGASCSKGEAEYSCAAAGVKDTARSSSICTP